MIDIKNKLDVLDKMIDCVQRKIRSNENMMGMINSTFEYETFVGYKPDQNAIDEMKVNVEALNKMLAYRSALLNYGAGITGAEPTLDLSNITEGSTTFSF